jgi:hypothetical protein
MISQMRGIDGDLLYMIHDEVLLGHFDTEEHQNLYQIPHFGPTFDTDCKTVYYQLKEYLLHMAGYAWIQSCDNSKDGHVAYLQLVNDYNTPGDLSLLNSQELIYKVYIIRMRSLSYLKLTHL